MSNTSARYRSQVHGSQFIGSRQVPVSPLVPVGLEVQFTSAVEQHDATVRQQYVFLFPLVFGRVVHGFVADSHAPLLQRTSQHEFDELATLLRRNPARNFRNAGAHSAYPPCSASSDRSSWVERAPAASRTMTNLVAYGRRTRQTLAEQTMSPLGAPLRRQSSRGERRTKAPLRILTRPAVESGGEASERPGVRPAGRRLVPAAPPSSGESGTTPSSGAGLTAACSARIAPATPPFTNRSSPRLPLLVRLPAADR